jgi:hypothetical protein
MEFFDKVVSYLKSKLNKYISVVTAFLILITGIAAFPLKTDASAEKIAALTTFQKYFRRTLGSFARADYDGLVTD